MVNKRIDIKDFELLISSDESIVITRDDLERVKYLSPRVASAIASALKHKSLRASVTEPEKLKRYPEITASISYAELTRFEVAPRDGARIADYMEKLATQELEHASRETYRRRVANMVESLADIVAGKTNGRFSAGFRNGYIVIVNAMLQNIALNIGSKVFKDAVPLCDKTARRKDVLPEKGRLNYKGFPADVILAIAAAGRKGLAVNVREGSYFIEGINRPYSRQGLAAGASGTNSYWQGKAGLECLTITFIDERLRILDLSNDSSLRYYEDIRGASRINKAYAFVVAAKEAAGILWEAPLPKRVRTAACNRSATP